MMGPSLASSPSVSTNVTDRLSLTLPPWTLPPLDELFSLALEAVGEFTLNQLRCWRRRSREGDDDGTTWDTLRLCVWENCSSSSDRGYVLDIGNVVPSLLPSDVANFLNTANEGAS